MVSSQRFQDVSRSVRAPHSPVVYSLRSKLIIPAVHAPWENEAKSLCSSPLFSGTWEPGVFKNRPPVHQCLFRSSGNFLPVRQNVFLDKISALQSSSIRSGTYCSEAGSVFSGQELIFYLWEWVWFFSIWKEYWFHGDVVRVYTWALEA